MTIGDIHNLALQLLNSDSSDYDSTKLMAYTNDGILFVQNTRIGANDPDVIAQMVISDTVTKPSDFFGFIPQKASYPLIADGTTIRKAVGASPEVVFKYSKKVSRVSSIVDAFPLPDEYSGFVAQYISIRLQSDNSMNVTQDMTILQNDIQAFIKAKGG